MRLVYASSRHVAANKLPISSKRIPVVPFDFQGQVVHYVRRTDDGLQLLSKGFAYIWSATLHPVNIFNTASNWEFQVVELA
jgi:hypothetical protein